MPRKQGILTEINISDKMYDITTEDIAQRVYMNQEALQLKFKKKSESQKTYYENKKTIDEIMNWTLFQKKGTLQ